MRYTYIELNNYIGIYSGLGLHKLQIDLSKGTHRVCIIKGTNGSGKTTLWNAISVFPDGNASFIPGLPASKIVRLSHKGYLYEIKFFHDVKKNSEIRETTKAYIAKSNEAGVLVEMNPNGNVSQYKDILYAEFRLDTNFFLLSKLSMDDRGLGYKRPADRKKSVTSIIDSLEVYNDIYKAATKKIVSMKAIISSITSNLSSLGDKNSLESLRESVDRDIAALNRERDEINASIARLTNSISHLDPDNSIRRLYSESRRQLRDEQIAFEKVGRTYSYPNRIFEYDTDCSVISERLGTLYQWLNFFKEEKTKLTNTSQLLINQAASLRERIRSLTESTESADINEIKRLKEFIGEVTSEAADLALTISNIGIDPSAFTKDEYILALETVHEIVDHVNQLRYLYPMHILSTCIKDFAASGYTDMQVLRYDAEKKLVDCAPETMSKFTAGIAKAEADLALAKKLEDRPDACEIDGCFFIADAVEASKRKPQEVLDTLTAGYEFFKEEVNQAQQRIAYCEQYNNCLNMMRVIVRSIDKNNSILTRLPNGGIFSSKAEFFEKLVGGESFEFIDRMYQYIHLANHFDMYKKLQSQAHEYYLKLDALEVKQKSYDRFEQMVRDMNAELEQLEQRLYIIKNAIITVDRSIADVQDQVDYINLVQIPACDQMKAHMDAVKSAENTIARIKNQINEIENYTEQKAQILGSLKGADIQISYKEKERDGIVFKLRQIEEYEKSLKEYKEEYQVYERIRYHSSPTTGIQLMFMQLYMGKILQLSNELLRLLFNGQYQLMPFIINEDEFRIPCAGNGYMNEDISSMSSSQLTMISMILSFTLLTVSSTEYNVIKLDEVDDPLDEPNRAAFAILLDALMDIMHTEQCIMISHSSELVVSNADVILLRTDGMTSIDSTYSTIWDYSTQ